MLNVKKIKKTYLKLIKKVKLKKLKKNYYFKLTGALVLLGIIAFSLHKGNEAPNKTEEENCAPICKLPTPAPSPEIEAYNSTARIDVCGCDCFVTGSYLYWQAREKGLELAEHLFVERDSIYKNQVIPMHFNYHSAFKVGIGFYSRHDNWSLFSQYTRYYSKNSAHKTVDNFNSDDSSLSVNHLNTSWFHQPNPTSAINDYAFRDAKSRWKLHLNLIDIELSRPYFVGTKLTFRPFIGAKGGLINQRYLFEGTLSINTPTPPNPINLPVFSHSFSNSWLVGPRMGVDTNWLLGAGFRFIGNGAINIFYQHFKTNIKQAVRGLDTIPLDLQVVELSSEKCAYFNTSFESLFGFGWGSYFRDNKWHFDLSAGYEVQLFLNQNAIRSLIDKTSNDLFPDGTCSNLMLHGLTVTGKIDF